MSGWSLDATYTDPPTPTLALATAPNAPTPVPTDALRPLVDLIPFSGIATALLDLIPSPPKMDNSYAVDGVRRILEQEYQLRATDADISRWTPRVGLDSWDYIRSQMSEAYGAPVYRDQVRQLYADRGAVPDELTLSGFANQLAHGNVTPSQISESARVGVGTSQGSLPSLSGIVSTLPQAKNLGNAPSLQALATLAAPAGASATTAGVNGGSTRRADPTTPATSHDRTLVLLAAAAVLYLLTR